MSDIITYKVASEYVGHCTSGSSDKVYILSSLVKYVDNQFYTFILRYAYGLRGSNLKEGIKLFSKDSLESIVNMFEKIVVEKTRKGYQDITDDSYSGCLSLQDEWLSKYVASQCFPSYYHCDTFDTVEEKSDKELGELTCIMNLGLEYHFVEGGKYNAKSVNGDLIVVDDMHGELVECLRERFKEVDL